jgi:putative iron-dependent peroxidase
MPNSPAPQDGILPEPQAHTLFLVLRATHDSDAARAIAKTLATVPTLASRLAEQSRGSRLVANVGLGSEFWDVLSPRARPKGLRPFHALTVGNRSAPNTGGDLFLHASASRPDVCFDLALALRRALGGGVEVLDEVHGFRYRDSRDLTGFIDGTENPKGRERAPAALIGAEDAAFAGGSYVYTQRYVHDLAAWNAVPVKVQEGIIGREKADSKELADKAKPATAHIARVVIEENGKELEIVRHSMPYGTVSEHGLFFVAYCRTLDIPEKMLGRMMGAAGDGVSDRLMDFSRAVTGATFFAPSLKVLARLVRL